MYFTEPGQDGIQQTMFVLDDNKESGRMTKEFDAPAQSRLGINRQTIRV
jgi:hypothetical protein